MYCYGKALKSPVVCFKKYTENNYKLTEIINLTNNLFFMSIVGHKMFLKIFDKNFPLFYASSIIFMIISLFFTYVLIPFLYLINENFNFLLFDKILQLTNTSKSSK